MEVLDTCDIFSFSGAMKQTLHLSGLIGVVLLFLPTFCFIAAGYDCCAVVWADDTGPNSIDDFIARPSTPQRQQHYLDPWGTKEEFAKNALQIVKEPGFDELPVAQQIQKLGTIYSSQKWADEATDLLSAIADKLWAASPEQAPNWAELIGPVVTGETPDQIAKSAAEQSKIFKDSLRGKGIEPALFGFQIDHYFDALSREEADRIEAKTRGLLGTIGAAGQEVGRGFIEGYTLAAAGVYTLAGYEETGQMIREIPSKVIRPKRDFNFETDRNGNILRDENGLPITRIRGAVLQGIGQIGSLFLGGAIFQGAGYGAKAIGDLYERDR